MIARYEQEHLYPLYDAFGQDVTQILTFVRGTQQNIFTSAGLMSQRLYQKNRQFEILSDTIDETFLIFEKNSTSCEFVSGSSERVLGLPAGKLKEDRTLIYRYMSGERTGEIQRELDSGTRTSGEVRTGCVLWWRTPGRDAGKAHSGGFARE